jgi:hypothetical protein
MNGRIDDIDEQAPLAYQRLLPMPGYRRVLEALHRLERPRNYLEIGIGGGSSLQLAGRHTFCVGVDPAPNISGEIAERHQIERMASDDFFAGSRMQELFGSVPIDMAFIDGMHLFEYALRDFMNVEQHSHKETLVVVHDFLPCDMRSASREAPGPGKRWAGDVWKLLLVLTDHRSDLEVCLLNAPPSGLGLVRRLDPFNTTLRRSYEALLAEYGSLSDADWEERQQKLVPRLLASPESLRWRKQLLRRIWWARSLHPIRSARNLRG